MTAAAPDPDTQPAPPAVAASARAPGERERRIGQAVAALALGLAVAAMALGVARAAAGAGVVALVLPPVVFIASALASNAGLASGLALLPLCLVLVELGLLRVGAGDLAATVHVATLPGLIGALAMRGLACRAARRPVWDRPRLALVAAVAATAVPVAIATALTLDGPDRVLTATYAIVGLVAATLVGVLAFAAGGADAESALPRVSRFERFDWRLSLLLGIVGGNAIGHVPFGPAELVLVYLVMRGFAPAFSAGTALAAGLVPALVVLPVLLLRHHIDFPLAFAIVPAAFSGSVTAGWWLRGANPLVSANALALLAVAMNLGIIVLALR